MFQVVASALLLFSMLVPSVVSANEVDASSSHVRATVVQVVSESTRVLEGIQVTTVEQVLEAQTDGGGTIIVFNDRTPLEVGDTFYAAPTGGGEYAYSMYDVDRRSPILIAVLLFAVATIAVGGLVGVRALISLAVSVALIVYMLLPLLAGGAPPVMTSIGFAAILLGLAMVLTHGFTRTTLAAYLSAVVTILIAIVLGDFFVGAAHLTGFTDDASTALSFSVGQTLAMDGLLLGAMIIGVLGIIDDLAITQVLTVAELKRANTTLSPKELFSRAMRVGKEHLGAVVNTLVLAYLGASMPLLILFTVLPTDKGFLLNSEIIATEIIRSSVGGVALALVVPIATALAVVLMRPSDRGHGHLH